MKLQSSMTKEFTSRLAIRNCLLFVAFLFFSQDLLAASAAKANISAKVCYVSSILDSILPRPDRASREMSGFETGIRFLKESNPRLVISFEEFHPVSKGQSVVDLLKLANTAKCDVIVGLVTSRDALLAAPYLKEQGMPGVSSTAVADELDKYFPYITTACTSTSSWADAAAELAKLHHINRPIILSNRSELFSTLLTDRLRKLLPDSRIFYLDTDGEVSSHVFQTINWTKPGLVIYTTYPIHSIPSLQKLAQIPESVQKIAKKNWDILGNPSWMEPLTFHRLRHILKKLPKISLISPWVTSSVEKRYREFKNRYVTKYKAAPDHDSTYDFDVMMMIGECLSTKTESENTRVSLLRCLSKARTFEGVTGIYHFNGHSAHPVREERTVDSGYSQ